MATTQDDRIAALRRTVAELRRKRDEDRAERNAALAHTPPFASPLTTSKNCAVRKRRKSVDDGMGSRASRYVGKWVDSG
jgi:hypothetical protein